MPTRKLSITDGGKRLCPTCGVATHKKGGLLGKKSVPITVDGRVYEGRCLLCDPFPPGHAPNNAAILAAIQKEDDEEVSQPIERVPSRESGISHDDGNRRTENSSPPAAIVAPIEIATKDPPKTARLKSDRSIDEQQQREPYHDSEEIGHNGKASGRKSSRDSKSRETQNYQQQQQPQHLHQQEHRPLQARLINEDYDNFDRMGIEETAPLAQSRGARAVTNSPTKAKSSGVPKMLEVIRPRPHRRYSNGYSNSSMSSNNLGDDQSVVSAITMDKHLYQSVVDGDEAIYDEYNALEHDFLPSTSYGRRPASERLAGRSYHNKNHMNNAHAFNSHERRHSIGGDMESHRRNRHGSNSNPNGLTSRTHHHHLYAPPAITQNSSPPRNLSQRNELQSDTYRNHIVTESNFSSNENINRRFKNHSTHTSSVRNTKHLQRNRYASYHDISSNHVANLVHDDDDDDLASFVLDDDDDYKYNPKSPREHELYQQSESDLRRSRARTRDRANAKPISPASSRTSSGPQVDNTIDSSELKKSSSASKPITEELKIDDMKGILHCLNLEECNPDIREKALCKLVDNMQKTSARSSENNRERNIREFVLEKRVIEAVTKSMWADMAIADIQDSALNALLFIAASTGISYTGSDSDGETRTTIGTANVLSQNESVCDSVLFTMQTHPNIHGIQLKGCLIFASLSASSSDNSNTGANTDGSLSGAITMVVNAMTNHGDSRAIRKAGLQTLHHQCLLSTYASANRRTFVESKLGNGMPAIDLVIYAMDELRDDLVAMEWACQLCWCLTTNEELLKHLEHTALHEAAMTVCQHYMTNPAGSSLVEASLGTMSNLASMAKKRSEMINTGAVELVLDGLRYHGDTFGICYEATSALENFALPPYIPDISSVLLKSDAVPLLTKGLDKFFDNPEYVVQGLRALTSIAARSDAAKKKLASPEILSIVEKSSLQHKNVDVIEICCLFVSTLAMATKHSVSDFLIGHGALDVLLVSMESFSDERVQAAACSAWRNLSCQTQEAEELLCGSITSKLIVAAMDMNRNSLPIQTNGCCTFGNLLSSTELNEAHFNPKIINSIIKAMQSHIESGELLELACGALWIIVDRFDNQKLYVGNEAIDVVTCAMVMHPGNPLTLEKACGLLSNLSSVESLAQNIAKAQGVSIIAEVMCNNATSISLLESGCLTLKNIVLVCPTYVQDCAVAIATIVKAMNENLGSTSFVKEACDLLWVLASQSEIIRSKVLALDGIATLMKCLQENSNHPETKTSALGAFNQLAIA